MNPDLYRARSASPTGTPCKSDVYVGSVRIICLDPFERLPMNWAVYHNKHYREFHSLTTARKFARAL